jgi:hypothetical protein
VADPQDAGRQGLTNGKMQRLLRLAQISVRALLREVPLHVPAWVLGCCIVVLAKLGISFIHKQDLESPSHPLRDIRPPGC